MNGWVEWVGRRNEWVEGMSGQKEWVGRINKWVE